MPVDTGDNRVGGFMGEGVGIEAALGRAQLEEKIIAQSEAVHPFWQAGLKEKFLPLLLVAKM